MISNFTFFLTFKEITATLTEYEHHQSHEITGGQTQLKGNVKGNKLCHVTTLWLLIRD